MVEVIRTDKFRLYPNARQKSLIHNHFGQTRYVYNQILGKIVNKEYGVTTNKKGEEIPVIPSQTTLVNEITHLKLIHSWLYQTGNDFLQASIANLYRACKSFLSSKGGFPKFKSRKDYEQSINFYAGSRAKFDENYVFLPFPKETQFNKDDFKIKYKKHKTNHDLPKNITDYTISKDNLNQYWISFTYKTTISHTVKTGKACGIDLGLKDLLITSDGQKFENNRPLIRSEKGLKRLQKSLSRKKKGSKNKEKARLKLAKKHKKVKNQRNHRNHVISRQLVDLYDIIAMESLQIKNMLKNSRLSKAISDVAWGDIQSKIEYKIAEKQGCFIKIDKFYPSTKTCSCCGNVKDKMSLSERTYVCHECGFVCDRDINAAINILRAGIKELLRNTQELSKIMSTETLEDLSKTSWVDDVEKMGLLQCSKLI